MERGRKSKTGLSLPSLVFPAFFWNNLERNYQEALARLREEVTQFEVSRIGDREVAIDIQGR